MSNTEETNLPTCPHCGKEDRNAWEWRLVDEEPETRECTSCGKPFEVTMHVYRDFDTRAV